MRSAFVTIGVLRGRRFRTRPAQDNRTAARDVVNKWQAAVVNVRVVLKMRMSMGGREMQASDDPVDTVGTVIDPSGLTVLSLGALNPGAMMSKIMGSAGGSRMQPSVEITTRTDRRQDQAVGRPGAAGAHRAARRGSRPGVSSTDEEARQAARGDRPHRQPRSPRCSTRCWCSSRLGRVGGWTAGAALHDVGAIIEKPRTFYVLGGRHPSMGTPAFLTNGTRGRPLTLRQIESRPGQHGLDDGRDPRGWACLAVILPAADVLEIAKQAPEK